LAALTDPRILELLAARAKDKPAIRLIDRALPQKPCERFLESALLEHGAEKMPLLTINLFAGGINGGHAATLAMASEVIGSLSVEADQTCCAVMKKIDELRRASGQDVEHTVLCKVLGKKGDEHEMDRGDGSKKVKWHPVELEWTELYNLIDTFIVDKLRKAGLKRDEVHVHLCATPPCSKICPHNSAEGWEDRRDDGMRLSRQTLEFCDEVKKHNLVDTFLFENVGMCACLW
jgi:hypothetical protein